MSSLPEMFFPGGTSLLPEELKQSFFSHSSEGALIEQSTHSLTPVGATENHSPLVSIDALPTNSKVTLKASMRYYRTV